MTYAFKVSTWLKPARGTTKAVPQSQDERKAICSACEWFQVAHSRCCRPNDKTWQVCYRSEARINPWVGIRRCGNWAAKAMT